MITCATISFLGFVSFWLGALFLVWLFGRLFLCGPDLSRFDEPPIRRVTERTEASPEIERIHELLASLQDKAGSLFSWDRLHRIRRLMDEGFGLGVRTPEELGVRLIETDAPGVPCEWVLAENADPRRRLLYVHGGAFFAGSPKSHRALTATLSRRARAAVLAVDYRLMPEHGRRAGIRDCRDAYRHLLEHGPEGAAPLDRMFLAGDSAGGNLALMLVAWARDEGLRPVDGAVALSPATDSTLSSPTYRTHVGTDEMLGPLFRPMLRLPLPLVLFGGLLFVRIHPRNPTISPLQGDLSGLPPVLVQASEAEILLGDGRRWVNKARSQGSPAELQTWPGMVHVWQIFEGILPEAAEALDQIEAFFERCEARAPTDAP